MLDCDIAKLDIAADWSVRALNLTWNFANDLSGSNDLPADNGHAEGAVTGTTDLYTKIEFDPWADALGESLSAYGIAWELSSVQYEEDTGFYHYEWAWEVA